MTPKKPVPPSGRTQRDLDPHLDRYAQRTAGMTASEIRALFAVASRPEAVSLAGGMPYLPALRWTRWPMTSPRWWPPKA